MWRPFRAAYLDVLEGNTFLQKRLHGVSRRHLRRKKKGRKGNGASSR